MRQRGLVRSHWVLITLITLITVATALALAASRPAKYQATASVLVRSVSLPASTPQPPDMVNEKQIVLSGTVAERAAALLGESTNGIRSGLSVDVPVDSDVLEISYTASSPQAAFDAATAFTRAYVEYRHELAIEAAGGAKIPSPTQIVTEVSLPTDPVPTPYPLVVGVSLVVGLGLGLATALLVDTLSGRVRKISQMQDLVGYPVVGAVPADNGSTVSNLRAGVDATGPGAEVYGRLAARFLQERGRDGAASLVVTSTVAGPGIASIAFHIAAALASAGQETLLVRAPEVSAMPAAARLLSDAASTGSAPSTVATLAFPTRIPRLVVVDADLDDVVAQTMAGGHQDGVEAGRPLPNLAEPGRLVVIEAKPLLGNSATALLTASVDATVLVLDPERETADQLVATGSVLNDAKLFLGCVIYDSHRPWWRRFVRRDQSVPSAADLAILEVAATSKNSDRAPTPSTSV
jgi:capsular polysaccharide biosynthesis protein